ncbi:cobalt-precorrin-5B (C(1))-methyltransferase [Synechococcus sp. RSCCF101]|uniref:cobalt-precorrin-5B (C(1))-methyltransferase CbiD n=1 Tax=Synechococcus sp. RSCCF101 TaxID=2511069 RepID=UPI001248675B|nr:cobalt-precorrin-5B (C(1))-methyltransferase CbiD [Synechococcus sp. RSCCF101]QEY32553.1 cobalt-precorrin-5B (C(1))-methyltransferase [Synechococcus sp. RSCCF101]
MPLNASRGYTLPVWVALAARAATLHLCGGETGGELDLDLPEPEGRVTLPLLGAASLGGDRSLGMCRCDPGPGLDLTRDLLVWVEATLQRRPGVELVAGPGVGRRSDTGRLSSSRFARQLIEVNVASLLPPGQGVRLQVVLPEGARLAERTSNAAFGVVEGLALIGTQARTQDSASPDQLQQALKRLREIGAGGPLVLVIGENGLELADRLGLPADRTLKAGNWLGPVLVEAARCGFSDLLLFGYHGKLIKLAGGVFHTHHHLADGRREILTSHAALEGLAGAQLQALFHAPSLDAAFVQLDADDPSLAERLRARLAGCVEERAEAYLRRYGDFRMRIGCAWFEKGRRLRGFGPHGRELIGALLGGC